MLTIENDQHAYEIWQFTRTLRLIMERESKSRKVYEYLLLNSPHRFAHSERLTEIKKILLNKKKTGFCWDTFVEQRNLNPGRYHTIAEKMLALYFHE
tara:strand:- start:40 stop:330 length:291 start_codon:yes stop_codon:yes gene_type:complete